MFKWFKSPNRWWTPNPEDQEQLQEAEAQKLQAEESYKDALRLRGAAETTADSLKQRRLENHFGPAVAASFQTKRRKTRI